MVAQGLYVEGAKYSEGWNFGPREEDAKTVGFIVDKMVTLWGEGASWQLDGQDHPHEAHYLKLDCSKAHMQLDWHPRWGLVETLGRIVKWHKAWINGADMLECSKREIHDYMTTTTFS